MADRPDVYVLPPWWLAGFEGAVKRHGLSNEQLIEMLVPEHLRGDEREEATKAKAVTVTRFRKGRSDGGKRTAPQGTLETIATFCKRLDLDSFIYIAAGPTEAAALAVAHRQPVEVLRQAGKSLGPAQAEPPPHQPPALPPMPTPHGVKAPAKRPSTARPTPHPKAEATVRAIVERAGVKYVGEDRPRSGQTVVTPSVKHAGEAVPPQARDDEDGNRGRQRKHPGPRAQRHRR